MARTVTAFGREWNHRQFYGLVRRLAESNYINFGPNHPGVFCTVHAAFGDGRYGGSGPTPWLALCEAVERMEGK